ncbi:hypothetical protein [uncultured Methanobrevibacter sp.]|uniref:hypothetical protein n=1 Tax=uncultured Methanobrevibacter sp. TaxID=253161 RepID=UPI00320B818B
MNTAVSPNFIPIAEEILQKSYKIVYYELNPIDQYLDKEENRINKLIQELNIKPSGFYSYDEEFIKISKEIYVRMIIIDAHTRLIINDQIIRREDFSKETIKKYFKESFKGLKLNTIITYGYSTYP